MLLDANAGKFFLTVQKTINILTLSLYWVNILSSLFKEELNLNTFYRFVILSNIMFIIFDNIYYILLTYIFRINSKYHILPEMPRLRIAGISQHRDVTVRSQDTILPRLTRRAVSI